MRGAGILRGLATRVLPRPAGYVDHFDTDRIAGWAVDPSGSGKPVTLSLHVDGQHVMNIAADLPRDDVAQTGRAPLRCGFDIALPARVRDGQAHLIEVRLGQDGPRLRGGRQRIAAGTAGRGATGSATGQITEGVVWYDRGHAAVAGWATGCAGVTIVVDGGAAEEVALTREVPGLGAGNRQGFLYPLPDALADGRPHEIEIRAGHWADGIALDGSPLQLSLGAARPRLSVMSDGPSRLRLVLRDRSGGPYAGAVAVRLDGAALPQDQSQPDAQGEILLSLPEAARHLTVTTAPAEVTDETPATVLGRFVIAPDGAAQDWSSDLPRSELDLIPLDGDLLARARAAFDAFAADPDGRFDAGWVAAAMGLDDPDAALAAWRDRGAAQGIAPGPAFDEAAARALHPGVAHALDAGALPCAFALELVLGAGTLGTMTGVARRQGAGTGAAPEGASGPIAAILPPITTWCPPEDSIYAAWLARLETTSDMRAAIEADERAARAEVASAPLLRQPLVTIIMPSWNRAFTIGEAIQSVMEQSYPNWELLICDDASEDRTADVVRGFDDPRIRYMRFQKSNGAGARNHGLRMARGEYIAYLDSDNMWHPLFLDLMLRRLMAAPGMPIAYAAYLDTETRGAAVTLQDISRPPFRAVQLSGKNFMDLNTIVHHRRVLDWMGGFDGRLPRLQDWDLVLRHTSVFGARFVDRIGVFYRRNIAWGQVTQTQIGSGAQDTVNAKTQARLGGAHEVLDIDWPAPSRVTVLCGPDGVGAAALAETLAIVARGFGSVDLVTLGDMDGLDAMADVRLRALPATRVSDPVRLGADLADLADAPMLVVGLDDAVLRQVPGLDPARVMRLVSRADGTWAEPLSDPALAFPLGALWVRFPSVRFSATDGALLVLGPDAVLEAPGWVAALQEAGLTAMVPPTASRPVWSRIDAEGRHDIAAPEGDVINLSASLVLGTSLADLSPWQMAVLNRTLSQGVPTAVPAEDDPESLAAQWIAARAAYALKSDQPDWIFEKMPKLLSDAGSMARLSERGLMVHRIALDAGLLQQRVAHMLWRLQFDPPRIEVLDGV